MYPVLYSSCHCKDKIYPVRYVKTKSFSQPSFSFFCQNPLVFSEELAIPVVKCSDFAVTVIAIFLSSYLCRRKRKANSSCSVCGHQLQAITHLLHCHASTSLRPAMFGTISSILDNWSGSLGVARLLGFREIPPRSILQSSGLRITTKLSKAEYR